MAGGDESAGGSRVPIWGFLFGGPSLSFFLSFLLSSSLFSFLFFLLSSFNFFLCSFFLSFLLSFSFQIFQQIHV